MFASNLYLFTRASGIRTVSETAGIAELIHGIDPCRPAEEDNYAYPGVCDHKINILPYRNKSDQLAVVRLAVRCRSLSGYSQY